MTNKFNLNNTNLNSEDYTVRSRKTSYNKTKTESSVRNKSNGIKFKERKENDIITNINNIKVSIEISYDDTLLNDSNNNINDKDFNIFEFSTKVGKGKVLPLIGNYIFAKYNFNEFMNLKKFRTWCEKISDGLIQHLFH